MTWSQSLGAATIYGPNNQGSKKIPFDKKEKGPERYFIVGCFDQRGFKSFVKVGKYVMAMPTSADICQEYCPEEDPNYHLINGKCYYLEKTNLSWEKAKDSCKDKFLPAGKLFEPKSWEENSMVFNFTKLHIRDTWTNSKNRTYVTNFYGYWIGVDDFGQDGSFKHSYSGEPISFNIRWKSEHPDGHRYNQGVVGNGPNCILVTNDHKKNNDGSWIDYNCDYTYNSICERHGKFSAETLH